jgi:uncharacterized protein YcfL
MIDKYSKNKTLIYQKARFILKNINFPLILLSSLIIISCGQNPPTDQEVADMVKEQSDDFFKNTVLDVTNYKIKEITILEREDYVNMVYYKGNNFRRKIRIKYELQWDDKDLNIYRNWLSLIGQEHNVDIHIINSVMDQVQKYPEVEITVNWIFYYYDKWKIAIRHFNELNFVVKPEYLKLLSEKNK